MKTRVAVPILLLMFLLLAACGQAAAVPPAPTPTAAPPATATPRPEGEPALDLKALIEALRASGAAVELSGEVQQPFFAVAGQIVRVNGAEVQVFEFADEAAARAATSAIIPEGSSVPSILAEWIATPHFYQAGRLVVLYVGEDAGIAEQLADVLGAPIAEGTGAGLQPEAGAAYAGLRDNLMRAGGLVDETNQAVTQPFFSVTGRLLRYQGQDIQVFEYGAPWGAAAEAALVAPDGTSAGPSMITWAATPHFFSAGTIIALYVGDDAEVFSVLETVLGPQFAGGAITHGGPIPPSAGCPGPDAPNSFINYKAGYCLTYPDGFQAMGDDPFTIAIAGPGRSGGPEPLRAGLSIVLVGPADGRTLAEAVDYVLGDVSQFEVTRTPTTLGGEAAERIEGLPGMVMTRQLVVVHGGNIYHLTFQPFDPSFTAVLPDATALWDSVLASFAFLS